jgi:hypothetical protein
MVLPLYNRGYHEVKIFMVLAFCQNLVFIEKNARYLLYLNRCTKSIGSKFPLSFQLILHLKCIDCYFCYIMLNMLENMHELGRVRYRWEKSFFYIFCTITIIALSSFSFLTSSALGGLFCTFIQHSFISAQSHSRINCVGS